MSFSLGTLFLCQLMHLYSAILKDVDCRNKLISLSKNQLFYFLKSTFICSAASGLGPLGVWSPEHVASVTVALIQSNCGMWGWHGGILVPPRQGSNHIPCIGRRILYLRTIREDPIHSAFYLEVVMSSKSPKVYLALSLGKPCDLEHL